MTGHEHPRPADTGFEVGEISIVIEMLFCRWGCVRGTRGTCPVACTAGKSFIFKCILCVPYYNYHIEGVTQNIV